MPKGYIPTEMHKQRISNTLKGRHISPLTEFKKGNEFAPKIRGKRELSTNWKGGINKHPNGYIYRYIGNGKQRREHILIWLKHNQLHRIPEDCVIHHCNGIKTDNRIENLQLMTIADHTSLHQQLKKIRRKANGGETE